MLRIGLNPYGIAYSVGLHGKGTPRANPRPLGLDGYVALAEEIGAAVLELPTVLLAALDEGGLVRLRERLAERGVTPVLSQGPPTRGFSDSLRCAAALGADVVRMSLTSVLCGDRAAPDCQWCDAVSEVRSTLASAARQAAGQGTSLAIENHQDFTSGELVDLCVASGPNVGVCLDVGNALAVGEDPVEFARTVASHVRHVHLKDYRAQWAEDGYRLVRCAVGDGAIPFVEVLDVLTAARPDMTAVIECGALAARHVRLLSPAWWEGYPDRSAAQLAAGLAAARVRRLPEDAEWRTPWEEGAAPEAIVRYEMDMLHRSITNLKQMRLML